MLVAGAGSDVSFPYYTKTDFYVKMFSPVEILQELPKITTSLSSRIREQQVIDGGAYELGYSEQTSAVELLRRTLVKTHTMTAIVGVSAPDSQGWLEQLVVK